MKYWKVATNMVKEKILRVKDVMTIMDCSSDTAYFLIRKVNKKLKEEGHLTLAGRVLASAFYDMIGEKHYE